MSLWEICVNAKAKQQNVTLSHASDKNKANCGRTHSDILTLNLKMAKKINIWHTIVDERTGFMICNFYDIKSCMACQNIPSTLEFSNFNYLFN